MENQIAKDKNNIPLIVSLLFHVTVKYYVTMQV